VFIPSPWYVMELSVGLFEMLEKVCSGNSDERMAADVMRHGDKLHVRSITGWHEGDAVA
jgi:hypothetical protein